MNGGCFIVSPPFSLKGEKHHFTNPKHIFFFFFFEHAEERLRDASESTEERLSDASESTEERLRDFALSRSASFCVSS